MVIGTAIGKILVEAPEDANVLCFSTHGMAANFTESIKNFS